MPHKMSHTEWKKTVKLFSEYLDNLADDTRALEINKINTEVYQNLKEKQRLLKEIASLENIKEMLITRLKRAKNPHKMNNTVLLKAEKVSFNPNFNIDSVRFYDTEQAKVLRKFGRVLTQREALRNLRENKVKLEYTIKGIRNQIRKG